MRTCILALIASLSTTHLASQERTEPTVQGVLAGRLTDLRYGEMHTSASEMIVEVEGRRERFAFWSPADTFPRLEANLNKRVIIEYKQGVYSPSNEALSENLYGTRGFVSGIRTAPLPPVACALDLSPNKSGAEDLRGITLVKAERRIEPRQRRPVLKLEFKTSDGAYREAKIFDVEMYECLSRLTEAGRPVDLSLAPSTIEGLSRLTGIRAQ